MPVARRRRSAEEIFKDANKHVSEWFYKGTPSFNWHATNYQQTIRKPHRQRWTIEVATEVCTKVGGIYTVLRTKAASFARELGNKYVLLGYITPKLKPTELINETLEPDSPLYWTQKTLESVGIEARVGRWNIDGHPLTIMLGFYRSPEASDQGKIVSAVEKQLKIKLPYKDYETIRENIKFGYLVARFVYAFKTHAGNDAEMVCLFHEWMSSFALTFLRAWKVNVPTVFTTHATILGRYLCEEGSKGSNFYNVIENFNAFTEARRLGIHHLHRIEHTAINLADVVTTVSSITATELRHLHGRDANVITPNGLLIGGQCDLHSVYRANINEFVRRHFFRNFKFDEDKVIYAFSAGRFEFRNKGIDLYIQALAELNSRLVLAQKDVTLVAFLIFPDKQGDINNKTLDRHQAYELLKQKTATLTGITDQKALDTIVFEGEWCPEVHKLPHEKLNELKGLIKSTTGYWYEPPPITTHNISDNHGNRIIASLTERNLCNWRHDRVKVVYHPQFLETDNPMFNYLDYQDFASGCDLGVFVSYYEPWGYTPAECHVKGTPAVTSNLSGYGGFLSSVPGDHAKKGIYIVDRLTQSNAGAVNQLAGYLEQFVTQSPEERQIQRRNCLEVGRKSDWRSLCSSYFEAMNLAVDIRKNQQSTHP